MVHADQTEDEYYASVVEVAEKFVKLIEKEGERGWNFLKCLGFDAAIKCEKPILETLTHPDIAHAVSLIQCEEPQMVKCAPKLIE
jgi:hypothetical protein